MSSVQWIQQIEGAEAALHQKMMELESDMVRKLSLLHVSGTPIVSHLLDVSKNYKESLLANELCSISLIIGESIILFLVQLTCNSRITVTEIVKILKMPVFLRGWLFIKYRGFKGFSIIFERCMHFLSHKIHSLNISCCIAFYSGPACEK